MSIVIAFVIIGVLGLLLGFGLSIAEKKLSIEKDPKLTALEEAMPGANCGGCGYAGCSAYAEAVFNGTAKAGLCSPGGAALAQKMGEILGIEVEAKEKMVAKSRRMTIFIKVWRTAMLHLFCREVHRCANRDAFISVHVYRYVLSEPSQRMRRAISLSIRRSALHAVNAFPFVRIMS